MSNRAQGFRGVVLVYHGLYADKETQRKELNSLGEAGFLAVGVDAVGHGERRHGDLPDRMRTDERKRYFLDLVRASTEEIPGLVQALRGLMKEECGFGITGISMGGYIAYGAALQEKSLKACVPILGSPDWGGKNSPHHRSQEFWPVALLAHNAGQDKNVPPQQSAQFVEKLRPFYKDDPGRCAYFEYPESDHFMREQDWHLLWQRTVHWFERHL